MKHRFDRGANSQHGVAHTRASSRQYPLASAQAHFLPFSFATRKESLRWVQRGGKL